DRQLGIVLEGRLRGRRLGVLLEGLLPSLVGPRLEIFLLEGRRRLEIFYLEGLVGRRVEAGLRRVGSHAQSDLQPHAEPLVQPDDESHDESHVQPHSEPVGQSHALADVLSDHEPD
ncbi:hypothetical protein ACHAWF_013664, partial [Thalassiosira exigua]